MGRNKHREAPEMAAFMRRMARALARRAADGDMETLSAMAETQAALDDAMREAARALHDSWDFSWTEIGRELGITRQAARQRFGREDESK